MELPIEVCIVIVIRKKYNIMASRRSDAETIALESAIDEYPGHDVYIGKNITVTG